MRKNKAFALVGLICIVAGIVLSLSGSNISTGTPPVDILYDQNQVVYSSGWYYDSVVIHNNGNEPVTVTVSVQNGLDYGPRISSPVQVCSGCTATVLIEDEPTVPNQTPAQFAYMMNLMTHPTSLSVSYASSPTSIGGANGSAITAGLIIIGTGILLIVYSIRKSHLGYRRVYEGPDDSSDYPEPDDGYNEDDSEYETD